VTFLTFCGVVQRPRDKCCTKLRAYRRNLKVDDTFIWGGALLWSPYGIGQTIFILWFVSIFFFFFPRLISAAAHWMYTILPHMVWP